MSPQPWRAESDRANPNYWRILDQNHVSIARVYYPANDGRAIVFAAAMRDMLERFANREAVPLEDVRLLCRDAGCEL